MWERRVSEEDTQPKQPKKENKLRFRKQQLVTYLQRFAKRPRALSADTVVFQDERCEGLVDLRNGQSEG